MRILQLINHTNILQLDIQKLIHTLQCPPDRDVILEFDRDFVVHQRFEETIPKLSVSILGCMCILGSFL